MRWRPVNKLQQEDNGFEMGKMGKKGEAASLQEVRLLACKFVKGSPKPRRSIFWR